MTQKFRNHAREIIEQSRRTGENAFQQLFGNEHASKTPHGMYKQLKLPQHQIELLEQDRLRHTEYPDKTREWLTWIARKRLEQRNAALKKQQRTKKTKTQKQGKTLPPNTRAPRRTPSSKTPIPTARISTPKEHALDGLQTALAAYNKNPTPENFRALNSHLTHMRSHDQAVAATYEELMDEIYRRAHPAPEKKTVSKPVQPTPSPRPFTPVAAQQTQPALSPVRTPEDTLREKCSGAISAFLKNPNLDAYAAIQQAIATLAATNPTQAQAYQTYIGKEMWRRGWLERDYKR
ncbi:MAG: hypothetical protein J4215_03505 [Candidatus Diapherotrites archaeon]|uniref:Uncharacterized protein n=1 Tax=Candidatus Iainarchaeum sp. TaxID=3101447 RepID=A0A8T4L2W8_9ARCH|nr:hypothetical protein [Candidatus Diapherotrites archaeon]